MKKYNINIAKIYELEEVNLINSNPFTNFSKKTTMMTTIFQYLPQNKSIFLIGL